MTTDARDQEMQDMGLPVFLEADEETELLRELGKELAEEFYETLHDAFPDWVASPFEEASETRTLITYLVNTMPQDVLLLRDPNYFKLYHNKLMPLPVSPFWLKLLSTGFKPFEEHRREFLRLVRAKILKKVGP